jgi:predicted transcriptional regulator
LKALLSIKPKYVEKIFSGEKRYEFRKVLFQKQEIESIVVYASSPVRKVIGEFNVKEILRMDVEELWEQTARHSGIDKLFFDEYFKGRTQGIAISVGKLNRYPKPLELETLGIKCAPQSFCYLGDI